MAMIKTGKCVCVCVLQIVLNEVFSHPLHYSTAVGWLYACGVRPHQYSSPCLHHTHPTVTPLSPQHESSPLGP